MMSEDVPEDENSDHEVRGDPKRAPSDQSLLRRFRQGNQDAADLLYHRYARRLLALVRAKQFPDLASRVDHEDIVQSVFGSFFRGVSRGIYDAPAGEELWRLFLVITLNKIRAKGVFHRASKRDVRMTIGGADIDRYPDDLKSSEDTYVLLKLAVEEAMDRLPAQHRLVVQLRMEGYEVAEIAQMMGRGKRSVERILQECRERLSRLGISSK
ncbi:MAG: RNA polymerase sigma factor [Solirubrobacterales bacterium]